MAEHPNNPKIQQTDRGLRKYCKSSNEDYNEDNSFAIYLEQIGIDDNGLQKELGDTTSDIIHFHNDTFPFMDPQPQDEDDRNQRIMDIIKICYNDPNPSFDSVSRSIATQNEEPRAIKPPSDTMNKSNDSTTSTEIDETKLAANIQRIIDKFEDSLNYHAQFPQTIQCFLMPQVLQKLQLNPFDLQHLELKEKIITMTRKLMMNKKPSTIYGDDEILKQKQAQYALPEMMEKEIKLQLETYESERKHINDTTSDDLEKSLHKFSAQDIGDKIRQCIMNDIKYKQNLIEVMRVFAKYRLSGKVICIQSIGSTKRMIKHDLSFINDKTLNIMFDLLSEFKDHNPKELQYKSAVDIAYKIYNYPLQRLMHKIIDDEIDGQKFAEYLVEIPDDALLKDQVSKLERETDFIQETTGWDEYEISQIKATLMKHLR